MKKYALINGFVLDGTKDMEPYRASVLVEDEI